MACLIKKCTCFYLFKFRGWWVRWWTVGSWRGRIYQHSHCWWKWKKHCSLALRANFGWPMGTYEWGTMLSQVMLTIGEQVNDVLIRIAGSSGLVRWQTDGECPDRSVVISVGNAIQSCHHRQQSWKTILSRIFQTKWLISNNIQDKTSTMEGKAEGKGR